MKALIRSMPHSRNIDTEVNAQYQMRDIVLWGCAAVLASSAAIATYLLQIDFDFPEPASMPASIESSVGGSNTIITARKDTETASKPNSEREIDGITTGSLPPKNKSTSSFGTTIARRQTNIDTARRMGDNSDQAPASIEPTDLAQDTAVAVNSDNISPGPIGIDLGAGYSFSILEKRFTALVNAAPTLFSELSARALIVEHESSIEAHLLVGPLKDIQAAQILCKKIQSRVNTPCAPANYTGRKLKLY